MKSRNVTNKKDVERVAQQVYESSTECINQAVAETIIDVCEYLGFGKKRANDLITYMETQSQKWHEASEDGILDSVINRELKDLGIDPTRIYEETGDIKRLCRNAEKNRQQPAVKSIREASEMQDKLQAMRELMKVRTWQKNSSTKYNGLTEHFEQIRKLML